MLSATELTYSLRNKLAGVIVSHIIQLKHGIGYSAVIVMEITTTYCCFDI